MVFSVIFLVIFTPLVGLVRWLGFIQNTCGLLLQHSIGTNHLCVFSLSGRFEYGSKSKLATVNQQIKLLNILPISLLRNGKDCDV